MEKVERNKQVLEMLVEGYTYKTIGERFGLSTTYVAKIKTRALTRQRKQEKAREVFDAWKGGASIKHLNSFLKMDEVTLRKIVKNQLNLYVARLEAHQEKINKACNKN